MSELLRLECVTPGATPGCLGRGEYAPPSANTKAWAAGWRREGGGDLCPACALAAASRRRREVLRREIHREPRV